MPKFKPIGQKGLDAVRQYLDKIPDDGKRRDVVITIHRERRTIPQNRLYRLWLEVIAKETGNSADDLHEVFKAKLLSLKPVEFAGATEFVPISTTGLDTAQFTQFLELLEAWVTSELGVVLPHPEDAFWVDFEQKYSYL